MVGDIVLVQAGEKINFDCIMVKGEFLRVTEQQRCSSVISKSKRKFDACIDIYDQMKQDGTLNHTNLHLVPSPVILSGSTIH
jgi:magnesium-transporting ATPase (P-type)